MLSSCKLFYGYKEPKSAVIHKKTAMLLAVKLPRDKVLQTTRLPDLTNRVTRKRHGGDDVPEFETRRQSKFGTIDKTREKLRRIYKENPAYFDTPKLAQKVY